MLEKVPRKPLPVKRASLYLLALLLVLFLTYISGCVSDQTIQPTSPPPLFHTEITMWKNGAEAALTLTFDDGYQETLNNSLPILLAHRMNATFAVPTGVAGKKLDDSGGCSKPPTNCLQNIAPWSEWQKASNAGMEIASHTVNHINLPDAESIRRLYELNESKRHIIMNIPNQQSGFTFVYPFGGENDDIRQEVENVGYISARSVEYGYNPETPPDFYRIRTVNPNSRKALEMNNWVNEIISNKGWLVEMWHLISPTNPGGYCCWNTPLDLDEHLNYVEEHVKVGDIWVGTYRDVVWYIQERDASRLYLVWTDNASAILNLTHNLSSDIYDFPLTLKTVVPDNWSSVMVKQGSIEGLYSITVKSNISYVYYNAKPNGVNIIISKG